MTTNLSRRNVLLGLAAVGGAAGLGVNVAQRVLRVPGLAQLENLLPRSATDEAEEIAVLGGMREAMQPRALGLIDRGSVRIIIDHVELATDFHGAEPATLALASILPAAIVGDNGPALVRATGRMLGNKFACNLEYDVSSDILDGERVRRWVGPVEGATVEGGWFCAVRRTTSGDRIVVTGTFQTPRISPIGRYRVDVGSLREALARARTIGLA